MFLKKAPYFLLFIGLCLYLQSCKVMYPNKMFKKGDYEYFQVDTIVENQYLIAAGDLLSLEIYAREGFELIDVLNRGEGSTQNIINRNTYLVGQDGFVELPIFGNLYVKNMTEKSLENLLEEKSSTLFNEPYAVLKVTNRRAFVFKGSSASVVSLNEGPTSLLEVIAKSGGLNRDLKAYEMKIIRGDLKNPEIIEIDLSTIAGLQNAELIVQANDVIYIEERLRMARGLVTEIAPVISLLSSTAAIIVLAKSLK